MPLRPCCRIRAAAALAALLLLPAIDAATTGHAEENNRSDLSRFLPNDGNSVYPVSGLLRAWPADGPRQLWRVEIGWGKSAVVEVSGSAYTLTETDDRQFAICLDPATGAMRWKHLLLAKPNRHFAWGPVTSPVVDEDRLYVIPYDIFEKDVWEMRCPIICLKTDGTELWRADQTFWGTEASTPLVVRDTLYVAADNPQRTVLVALDKRTGALKWSVTAESEKQNELVAPASLTYQEVDGVPQVIVATYGTREVLGVHAVTGEIMWRCPYPADIIIGLVSTPVAVGSQLLICGGEGKGKDFSAACKSAPPMARSLTASSISAPSCRTTCTTRLPCTRMPYSDSVAIRQAGQSSVRTWRTADCCGNEKSREWTNEQNLVIADGLIFAITSKGELVLADASRDGYRELGRVKVPADLDKPQQPTIANGRLYIRGTNAVVCYQVGTN